MNFGSCQTYDRQFSPVVYMVELFLARLFVSLIFTLDFTQESLAVIVGIDMRILVKDLLFVTISDG